MPDAELEDLQHAVGDRYDVEGLVGRGGMGAVFRARHRSLDSPVAIKVLPMPASLGTEGLARFRREAMLAARLPHPHIVPVFEFEVRGDLAYLVMPLVDGVSLAERLAREGPLSLADARTLAAQIGSALSFAHARGIIHRDVKPANILWEPANGRWLITDFGIARPAARGPDEITSVGAVLGTPAYMAPEQAAGADLDGGADLYSLAATICEALTAKRLKPMADPAAGATAVRAARPDVPERVLDVLTRPLALDPANRPASVDAWLAQISALDRRPAWVWKTGLAAAAVAVVAAGIAGLRSHPSAPGSPAARVVAVLPFADSTSLGLGQQIASAFRDELRWIPGVQVAPSGTLTDVLARTSRPDSAAAAVLADTEASSVIVGRVELDAGDRLRVSVTMHGTDGSTSVGSPRSGPPDSLAAIVSATVSELFAGIAGARLSSRPALPGGGLAATRALFSADSLFRIAAYDAAIAQYDRVLTLDSTYALAAFKRMLAEVMRTQPTRASLAVRAALAPARRYRANLDPLSLQLLEAYELLLAEGDVEGAHARVRDLTVRYPLAADAWFVQGYLEFYFGPLFGTPPTTARWALSRVAELEPGFAAAHGLLGWIALLDEDERTARTHLGTYLALDSTSSWAALVRFVDSLRFRGGRVAVSALRRIGDRPTATLELFALAGSSLRLSPAERIVVGDAARALRERATMADERAIAFRLQLGNAVGAGHATGVDSLLREARSWNVPRGELDRALVLLAVTRVHDPDAIAGVAEAAERLVVDSSGPDGPWLAARWFRGRDAARERQARALLGTLARRPGGSAILARSLLTDLEALDRLAAGDTSGAYEHWHRATSRFHFEEVPFGLVASLWPLRLTWAGVADAQENLDEVLRATATFEFSPGFMGQAGRPIAVPLRAAALDGTGDRLQARELRRTYARALDGATGRWAALRDSLTAGAGRP